MKKYTIIKNTLKYDIAFISPSFEQVIEAISSQKNGQKILLVFPDEINRNDRFQITQTFPFHVFQIFKSAQKSRMLKEMFLLCPHLIQPQKVISLQTKQLKTFSIIIDLFYKNQLKEKSTLINQKVPENLSFLNINNLKGIVFQEYKINVSRLLIELLKYFETIGGKVQVNKGFDEDETSTIVRCNPENRNSFITNIDCPVNFVLETKIKNNRFRFLENNNFLEIDFNKNLTKNEVQESLMDIISTKNITLKKVENTSWLSTKSVSTISKTIKSSLPRTFANTQMKDNYELCLEKFDIAKQTGIVFPEFKILFHRYGNGIDEMIDEAYEKMNKTRDPQKIWNEVEDWFQRKYEWKVE